uniref:Uncharacterized protein n=1 Tax=Anguilla anguilla TaxID=7936 RepID=A0A0E9SW79_ANGAN
MMGQLCGPWNTTGEASICSRRKRLHGCCYSKSRIWLFERRFES